MLTWQLHDLELVLLYRYAIPSDMLEFMARLHAEKPGFWKVSLPSAFSWLRKIWHEEAWLNSATKTTGFFSSMIHGMLGKRKKKQQ